MRSYWDHERATEHDVIVVGGGLVGLSTATELAVRRPGLRILVLERGVVPEGATTRNAGIACFGSLTELLSDMRRHGDDAALALAVRRHTGLRLLRETLGDAAIGYEPLGGHELITDAQLPALDELGRVNGLLRSHFDGDVFDVVTGADGATVARSWGFGASVRAVLRNAHEGQLHSGKLMTALLGRARTHGVEIRNGADVTAIDESGGRVEVHAGGVAFRAAEAVVCVNGFTTKLLPELGIVPARGQVLVTEPLGALPWRGGFHYDEGFVYFRNIGDRVLLGGARNLDFAGEDTGELTVTAPIQSHLESLLRDVILPGRAVTIAHRWAGIMGFSPDRQPIVKRTSPRVTVGFGCNGMGVALGSLIARDTATLVLGSLT